MPYEKAQVKDAPTIDPTAQLSHEEESDLYGHYGLTTTAPSRRRPTKANDRQTTAGGDRRRDDPLRGGAASRRPSARAGRARLRKYVVTEQVTQTVPVQREEVRVEREPITDDNADAATDGPAISEEEHEVVLHEEEVVVEKQTVPKERVRLEKDTVTDEQRVSEDGPQGADRRRRQRGTRADRPMTGRGGSVDTVAPWPV